MGRAIGADQRVEESLGTIGGRGEPSTGGEALDLNRLLVSTHLSYQSEQLSPLERARSQGDSRPADM
jgi:hypothetical protein